MRNGIQNPERSRWLVPTMLLPLLVYSSPVHGAPQTPAPAGPVHITVLEDISRPAVGVTLSLTSEGFPLISTTTDSSGHATLQCPSPRACRLSINQSGFQALDLPLNTSVDLQINLIKAVQHSEVVEVQADAQSPLITGQSGESKVSIMEATETALRPATVADTLPLIPGVIRTPDGQVNIAGLGEQHSVLIVNAVDVSDPATGKFGLSVPVDSVETVKVLQSPFLAEYGNFTAGVVSAETRGGGDKWAYSLNDPMPEVRIRSGHLVGLRAFTPRLNFSGPIVANRLYMLESSEFLMHKDAIRTLPFPVNETRSTAFNSFTQLDTRLTPSQTLTATVHFAPRRLQYIGLNFFDPLPVTSNGDFQEDTGTVTHRAAIGGGLLSSTFAYTRVASNVGPQAVNYPTSMTLTPVGDTGSYFSRQNGGSSRIQVIETWTSRPLVFHGQHRLQAGTVIAHAEDEGNVSSQPVRIADGSGNLLQDIFYSGKGDYNLSDIEPAVYFEDHWIATTRLALDIGLRWETQSVTSTTRMAPRAGFTWTPTPDFRSTVIRGGMGVFYDQVPLNVYAFRSYPTQTVTTYTNSGSIADGPRLFQNLVDTNLNKAFALVDRDRSSGNFSPYSVAWTLEAEHSISTCSTLGIRYRQTDQSDQLTLNSMVIPGLSALILGGSGSGHVRQLELTSGFGAHEGRHFYFSYVRQYSRGSLSDVSGYLGSSRYPVVRSLTQASNSGEIPNRFLLWGTTKMRYRTILSPHVEYRDGFTYQRTDALQQYVLPANGLQTRYPRYFSLDARISKDIDLGPKHAIRLALNGLNLTDHQNFLQVHNNIADPQVGNFFGNYGRHLLVDFDFLF